MTREEAISWLVNNWYLLAILGLTELMPFLPVKANGIVHLAINLLKMIGNKGAVGCFMLLSFMGCTPMISNVVQMGCGEDKVSLSNKADSDQAPTNSTSAAVPVSVGASPVSSAAANK